MTRLLMAVTALVLVSLGAASLDAHERFRFIGTIVKMNTGTKLLIMKTGQKDHPPQLEIGITPKTRIERDGRKVAIGELKAGRYVVVDALGDDLFDVEAVLVKIVPPPAKPAGAK